MTFEHLFEPDDRGRIHLASKGKKKTTMAKLNRETRLREKRYEKEERKVARRAAAAEGTTDYRDNGREADLDVDRVAHVE